MAGLSLNMMGGAKVVGGNSGFSPTAGPNATAGAMAFGPGYTATGTPSTASALAPNDPFGITFWAGIISLAGLLFLRHSLPG